jgi:hypothetical protein
MAVAKFWEANGWHLEFRRTLGSTDTTALDTLFREVGSPSLPDSPDEFTWAPEPSGKFSDKSLDRRISLGDSRKQFLVVWNIAVPLKIRISMWQLSLKRLPPSDNIKKR